MVNEKENVVAEGAQIATKKIRRGVSNKTQAVAQLKFHEKDAAQNGLFVGHLEEVRVDWSNSEDSKDFPSMAVPRLTIILLQITQMLQKDVMFIKLCSLFQVMLILFLEEVKNGR